MQALSGFPAIRCSTLHLNQNKIRRQHDKRPGSAAFTALARRLDERRGGSTLGLVLYQTGGFVLQHPLRRLWRKASASEDDAVNVLEASKPAEEVTEPEPVEEVEVPESGPTAKVNFVLQKECRFGQQYNVVGDNSYLGNWDPTAAVPLVWSEGHIWSSEVDVPAGRVVEYKFLLTGKRGELEWQPGPNQSFEVGEDEPTLVVSGTWDTEEVTVESWADNGTTQESETEASVGVGGGKEDEEAAVAYIQSAAEGAGAEASLEAKSGEGNGQLPGSSALEVPIVDFGVVKAAAEVSEEVVKQLEEAAATE